MDIKYWVSYWWLVPSKVHVLKLTETLPPEGSATLD